MLLLSDLSRLLAATPAALRPVVCASPWGPSSDPPDEVLSPTLFRLWQAQSTECGVWAGGGGYFLAGLAGAVLVLGVGALVVARAHPDEQLPLVEKVAVAVIATFVLWWLVVPFGAAIATGAVAAAALQVPGRGARAWRARAARLAAARAARLPAITPDIYAEVDALVRPRA